MSSDNTKGLRSIKKIEGMDFDEMFVDAIQMSTGHWILLTSWDEDDSVTVSVHAESEGNSATPWHTASCMSRKFKPMKRVTVVMTESQVERAKAAGIELLKEYPGDITS